MRKLLGVDVQIVLLSSRQMWLDSDQISSAFGTYHRIILCSFNLWLAALGGTAEILYHNYSTSAVFIAPQRKEGYQAP